MIGVAAAVVPHGGPDHLGHLVEATQQILDGEIGELRIRFDCLVQVVDVRLVMCVMMELHRLGINVRLEGIVTESQRRKLVRHVRVSLEGLQWAGDRIGSHRGSPFDFASAAPAARGQHRVARRAAFAGSGARDQLTVKVVVSRETRSPAATVVVTS